MWEGRSVERILFGKSEGKRTLGSSVHTRWDNIKMVFEKRVGTVDWIDLSQFKDRGSAIVYTTKKTYGFRKIWEISGLRSCQFLKCIEVFVYLKYFF
jgi:hypothetical protein